MNGLKEAVNDHDAIPINTLPIGRMFDAEKWALESVKFTKMQEVSHCGETRTVESESYKMEVYSSISFLADCGGYSIKIDGYKPAPALLINQVVKGICDAVKQAVMLGICPPLENFKVYIVDVIDSGTAGKFDVIDRVNSIIISKYCDDIGPNPDIYRVPKHEFGHFIQCIAGKVAFPRGQSEKYFNHVFEESGAELFEAMLLQDGDRKVGVGEIISRIWDDIQGFSIASVGLAQRGLKAPVPEYYDPKYREVIGKRKEGFEAVYSKLDNIVSYGTMPELNPSEKGAILVYIALCVYGGEQEVAREMLLHERKTFINNLAKKIMEMETIDSFLR